MKEANVVVFSLSNIDFFFKTGHKKHFKKKQTVFCELTKSSCFIITTHLANELPELIL